MSQNESAVAEGDHDGQPTAGLMRKDSLTASEWVNSQLQLEADAREALPYSFDSCSQPLGPLRQSVFACLTCHPPPQNPSDSFTPAGVCYGCSISCHGEHTLVEIFARRHFICDCGTTRYSADTPCTLRINPATGTKGAVHSQEPAKENEYNKNFQNRFCGCNEWYDAEKQMGTMYQCLGLASEKDGGCGEDWWHPECLIGLPKDWHLTKESETAIRDEGHKAADAKPVGQTEDAEEQDVEAEHPIPPGFPDEDDFDTLICYKCVNATPWLRDYADSTGFMTLTHKALPHQPSDEAKPSIEEAKPKGDQASALEPAVKLETSEAAAPTLKRTLDDAEREDTPSKKSKVEDEGSTAAVASATANSTEQPKHANLPPPPSGEYSILTTGDDFRDQLCRCATCYPQLARYPQLLEEEETYQPPLSENGEGEGSGGTASLLDRGEAALSNMDRVKAIEGVMVYNHLKDKVKTFLQPFAESGQAVGAEDIKAYFEKLRGDAEAIKAAGSAAAEGEDGGDGDNRKEQSGY